MSNATLLRVVTCVCVWWWGWSLNGWDATPRCKAWSSHEKASKPSPAPSPKHRGLCSSTIPRSWKLKKIQIQFEGDPCDTSKHNLCSRSDPLLWRKLKVTKTVMEGAGWERLQFFFIKLKVVLNQEEKEFRRGGATLWPRVLRGTWVGKIYL